MNSEPVRMVDAGRDRELTAAMRADSSEVRIVCPFIKERALDRLLSHRPGDAKVDPPPLNWSTLKLRRSINS